MSLANSLEKISSRKNKRVGRGYGSGKGGHTASRGQKGQKSRVGSKIPLYFEGGSLPLTKRLPMWRGKGKFKVVRKTAEITFKDINSMELTEISLDALKLNGLIDRRFSKAKIIKNGKLNRKVNVKGLTVSASARSEIEDLGGKIE